MKKTIRMKADDVKPERNCFLNGLGIVPGRKRSERTEAILDRAMQLFLASCHPIGMISEVSIREFEILYHGEGLNEEETPLDVIFRKADTLAIFAATLGSEVSERIDELFKSFEFALGSMLDSVASEGTERAVDRLEEEFFDWLVRKGRVGHSAGILRYSPGYCGWHMSGQRKLFEFLHPEEIGITLLESFIMVPLKSITGVMVVGRKEIHQFEDSYPFCKECRTHSCRDRIRKLMGVSAVQNPEGGI